MRRDINLNVPAELRDAEELLERYGRWAQDRYKKQRCASAEGRYVPPPTRSVDCDEPLQPLMPDWSARQVQMALQVVPMQWRRVLFAFYIPQRKPWQAMRRVMGGKTWDESKVAGLREFWKIYSLRYLACRGSIAALTRD